MKNQDPISDSSSANSVCGSYEWTKYNNGRLSFKEKITLMNKIMQPSISQFLATALHLDRSKQSISLNNIVIPDTHYVKEAIAELEHCANLSLIAHSWRTYYWGAAFGIIDQTEFDPEMLLIGCLLHDLGFTDVHAQQDCGCFTLAGAEAAKTWSAKVNYPIEKADVVADMICLHMNGYLDENEKAESRLLQQGASCDVIGARFYQLDTDYRSQVLQQQPRQNFNQIMSNLVTQEAKQNPDSRTALMKKLGLPLMLKLNPFKE